MAGRTLQMPTAPDQARLPVFRVLLAVQVLSAGFFGVFPYLVPETFAGWFGLAPEPLLVYRLAGAASLGYAAMALAALVQPDWYTLRYATVATLGFNAAAVIASLLAVLSGEAKPLVWFILGAGAAFAVVAIYWLARDEGPDPITVWPITLPFWVLLLLATLAATVFGLGPLLVPGPFATVSGLPAGEVYIYRLAGAATVGYALAGIFELRSSEELALRIPVMGGLTFNALSAIAALAYLAGGGSGIIGPVVALAATFFSLAFAYWLTVTGSFLRG